MNTKRLFCLTTATVGVCALLAFASVPPAAAADKSSAADLFFKNAQHGNPNLKSIGTLSFGPQGLLLVAEPRSAAIVAIDTGDTGPVMKLKQRVDDIAGLAAAGLGAPAGGVQIVAMAVNPASGKIYLSVVRTADKQVAILTIDADGKLQDLALDKATYVRVPLPSTETAKVQNISDLAFAKDRVLAAGQSNEEFSSKIYSLPIPLTHDGSAKVFSAETYHVAHGRWETKAPIQSFIPYEENGKHFVVGAFACTPIAKFPLDDIQSGGNIRGTSVMELGSGNKPLGMFTYDKGGKKWLVTNTYRMQFKKDLFGPSRYWGVRMEMSFLLENNNIPINEKATRRDEKEKSGPGGVEIMDELSGAVHIDKLNNDYMVVLRESGDKLNLEMAKLP